MEPILPTAPRLLTGNYTADKTFGFFAGALGYSALLALCTIAYSFIPALSTPTYAVVVIAGLLCLAPSYIIKKAIEPRFPDFACTVMAGGVAAALILAYLGCWSLSLHAVNPQSAWYRALLP